MLFRFACFCWIVFGSIAVAQSADEVFLTRVSASGAEKGNEAIQVLDKSSSTRWAQQGKGEFVELEFSAPVKLSEVSVGFVKGTRNYHFSISSSADGETWSTPIEKSSNGKGDALEAFKFDAAKATHLRIINRGNSDNDWINIHTITIPSVVLSDELAAETKLTSQDSNEGAPTGGLELSEFATTGMIGSPVGISIDNQGRVFVTETWRRKNAAPDVRSLSPLMLAAMAARSPEDKADAIRKYVNNWKNNEKFQERIIQLEDTTGNGQADKKSLYFEGLTDPEDGVAAGVLCFGDDVYLTCIPSLYKFRDTNNDGKSDEMTELVRGLGIHIGYSGHDMHGPTIGPDGRIYWSMGDKGVSVKTKEGKHVYLPGQGGVFRVEPDGSNFEVFVYGGRNPQELAFDEFGNLFIADNDGDMGDKERLHFVPRGCDVGWRSFYQYRGKNYNPWMKERIWETRKDEQPAYLLPPLAYTANGPCGFVFNPGGALNEAYKQYFFLSSSDKSTAAFQIEPRGAGFERTNRHTVLKGVFATGLAFSPDGNLYAADWGNQGWRPHDKGRVIKLSAPEASNQTLVAATKRLLNEGMIERSATELAVLLAHEDQRVRLESQFELVRRNDAKTLTKRAQQAGQGRKALLARIHAIWGVGQLGRKDASAAEPLAELLKDTDPEIKAQAAQMLGEAGYAAAGDAVAELLADESPRVRLLAGIALEQLGQPSHLPAALTMLEENAGADLFLRHAGVMALIGIGRSEPKMLVDLANHHSADVQLAAVVALRRLGNAGVERFLNSTDSNVADEAARAIHDDLSIPHAMPELAQSLEQATNRSEAFIRRAISANRRLADADSAVRLAKFAANQSAERSMRVEAIATLGDWNKPLYLDHVQGFLRELGPASLATAHSALDQTIGDLLSVEDESVQDATTKAIASLRYSNALERVTQFAFDEKQSIAVRRSALSAMAALDSARLGEALKVAIASDSTPLRTTALTVLADTSPASDEAYAATIKAFASDILAERQAALSALGSLTSSAAEKRMEDLLNELKQGSAAADIQLDILLAATKQSKHHRKMIGDIKQYKANLADHPLGLHSLALEGGDPAAGEAFFKTSSKAQCTRCHRLGGSEESVGPDLAKIAGKRDRAYLLRAIVTPSADIDQRYRTRQFLLDSGKIVSGSIVSETDDAYMIAEGVDKITRLLKDDIEDQVEQKVSIMPEMAKSLSPQQVRDLVAYLSTLK